jgi:hypothetical protein
MLALPDSWIRLWAVTRLLGTSRIPSLFASRSTASTPYPKTPFSLAIRYMMFWQAMRLECTLQRLCGGRSSGRIWSPAGQMLGWKAFPTS